MFLSFYSGTPDECLTPLVSHPLSELRFIDSGLGSQVSKRIVFVLQSRLARPCSYNYSEYLRDFYCSCREFRAKWRPNDAAWILALVGTIAFCFRTGHFLLTVSLPPPPPSHPFPSPGIYFMYCHFTDNRQLLLSFHAEFSS